MARLKRNRRLRRNRASAAADTVDELENLALLGGIAFAAYWIVSGKATAFLCPGGGGICALWPQQTTMQSPLPPIGTAITHATVPSIPQGDLVVMTSSGPQTYGPNGLVPGTGQTVNGLRSLGYADSDIAAMIEDYESNPGAFTPDVGLGPAGGAGGSW
jgi:hypothetical protein